MVLAVGLPAPSFSVTVMSKGAAPGQVTGTHASLLTAATAAVPTQLVDPPSATHRLVAAAPSEAGRPAASAEVVWAQTLNCPAVSSVGPKKCPSAGELTVRAGGVVSTGKLVSVDVAVTLFAFLHVAFTW